MDNSDIEKMLEMKNVSDETAERIALKYPPLSEEKKKRIISRLDIMNENEKTERQIRVVRENKKKPVFKIAACAAAVLITAGVGLKLLTDSKNSDGHFIPAATPEITEEVTEAGESDYKADNLPYFDVPPIIIPENIEGLTEEEAADLIKSLNIDKEYDLETKFVLSETIEKGLAVKAQYGVESETDSRGNNYTRYLVTLYVSSGKLSDCMNIEIPVMDDSLTGLQFQDMLEEYGFNVQLKLVYDENIPDGYAVKTDPPAGTKAEYGSTVVLYVSRGKMTAKVKLPDVKGMTESEAEKVLSALDLKVEKIYLDTDEPKGTVTGMSDAPGSVVETGSKIILFVSNSDLTSMITEELEIPFPEKADGIFVLKIYRDGEIYMEYRDINTAYEHRKTVSITYCGADREIEIHLVNQATGAEAELGKYRISFDGTHEKSTISEDIYGAFETVGGLK